MKATLVIVSLVMSFPAFSTHWYILDSWECPEVPGDESNPTDTSHAFGLAYRDNEIFVGHFNADDLYPTPPYLTNLWVYDTEGNYQGTHFPEDITEIDTSGVDWKSDSDHGGVGWYMGARRESTVYLVADNGSSYSEFAGPSNFGRMYGVAHNPDDDILYVSDWSTGWVAWGSVDGSGHVSSWTQESVGIDYNALKYVSHDGTDYLFAHYRGESGSWDNALHIFVLDASGIPNDIYIPDEVIDWGGEFYFPGDIDWDGDNLWLLDQNRDNESGSDYPTKIALPGFSSYTVNIQPASLGAIKAQFK